MRNSENVLEQARSDKIESLGFLCYNLHVDGTMVFPETSVLVNEIQKEMGQLFAMQQSNVSANNLRLQEKKLEEKLNELGCICYNLYIDRKLFNNQLLSLCNSISAINFEILNGLSGNAGGMGNKSGNYPAGMEPIPKKYKGCRCGYRNRPEAVFCGKCGAKLP